MADSHDVHDLVSRMALDAQAIGEAAYQLEHQVEYFAKADLNDAAVTSDIRGMAASIESLANQIKAVRVAASLLPELPHYHLDAQPEELASEIESALEGESVFLFADGTLPQTARFAASVHGLLDDDPLYPRFGGQTYLRGSLIGFLFRRNNDASSRLAGRAKDALVGKASAEMTHEEVRAYREFVEATTAVPSAILITSRYAFAKVASGVFAFHLDTTRKEVLRQEPVLALSPESFVKRMLDLPQSEDLELTVATDDASQRSDAQPERK